MASNGLSTGNVSKNKIGQGLSSLHHTTKRLLGFEKIDLDSIENFEKKVERLKNDPNDSSYLNQVNASYSYIHSRYHKLIEEEKLIGRMERKAHIRNTFFRGLVTLVIGFSIMLVYWVASCLKIAMPLMKLPV